MTLASSLAAAAPPALEPLFPPAALHGVHGLAFDDSGRLLAAESWGMAVHRIDPATGRIETLHRGPDAASDDVGAFPAGHPFAGTVAWTANFVGRVMARDPDGTVRELARDLPGINTLVIAPDGRLLVTQTGPAGRLLEIDPAGRRPPVVLFEPSGGLNGFAITREGLIVGPQQDEALSRIVEIEPATRTVRVIASGFNWPTGVKRAPSGEYFAVDLGRGDLLRFDPRAAPPPTRVASFEPGLDNLAVAPDGKVFVSHIPTSSIWEVEPRTGRRRAVVRGRFGVPAGLACVRGARGDELYLADVFTIKRVEVARRRVTTLVPLDRRSPFPTSVTVHGPRLVVSSAFTGTIVVLDRASGRELRRLKGFRSPQDAVELDDGSLLVAESGARQLTRVGRDDSRTRLGDVADDFRGLASGASGHWYATGGASGMLHRIDVAAGTIQPVASGLGTAEGIAAHAAGTVLRVVDAATGTLRELDVATPARVRTVRDGLPLGLGAPAGLPPSRVFHGVAAGECRDTWIASDRDGTIYRLAGARRGVTPPLSDRSRN